jgi:hypothetical protein
MKELWRLLLPGMNVPACGVSDNTLESADNGVANQPAATCTEGNKPDVSKS